MKKLLIFILLIVMVALVTGCKGGTVIQVNTPVPGQSATNGEINVPAVSIPITWPGPNPLVNNADLQGHISNIGQGIWHGIISPVTLVVSFVNPDVQMYEVHNDGGPYNLGFFIGVAIVFLLLGGFAGSRRRR
jgi:hypothetical protein